MTEAGYIVAGYSLTALVLGLYTAALFRRARRARRRVDALAERKRFLKEP